ncbi:hypothetical protein V6N11_050068 [Hibiscus sabdariffa]|uniref:Uncharacterized protein n=1 Tax=Hibiscus sabdariffa TaxID=183260 RepID=A0ABR2T945_9ROSI
MEGKRGVAVKNPSVKTRSVLCHCGQGLPNRPVSPSDSSCWEQGGSIRIPSLSGKQPRDKWILARNDQPGRIRKQQYLDNQKLY